LMKVIGYHGTEAKHIDDINKNGYNFSENGWFGEGVYFFETLKPLTHGEEEAIYWAIKIKRCDEWAVFKAIIESSKFIDLIGNNEHKILYDQIKKRLLSLHLKSKKDRTTFKESIIFKTLQKEKDVDFMRVMVDASDKQIPYGYVIGRFQVQVCVKKSICIKKNELWKQGNRKL